MAVTQNTLIGKSRGSVGGTTFTKWKGLNVLKSKAVNNYTDPTTEQVNNNSKFAVMQAFMKTIAIFIVAGFKAMAVNVTEFNAFSSANKYSQTITGSPGSYVVDPEEIVISKGPELQYGLTISEAQASGANAIEVAWNSNPDAPQDAQMYAATFNTTTGELLASSIGTAVYSDGSLQLTATGLGTAIASTVTHLFYVNPANGKACDSVIVPNN